MHTTIQNLLRPETDNLRALSANSKILVTDTLYIPRLREPVSALSYGSYASLFTSLYRAIAQPTLYGRLFECIVPGTDGSCCIQIDCNPTRDPAGGCLISAASLCTTCGGLSLRGVTTAPALMHYRAVTHYGSVYERYISSYSGVICALARSANFGHADLIIRVPDSDNYLRIELGGPNNT